MRALRIWARLSVITIATAAFRGAAAEGSGQVLRQRIVSTSGVPHGDIANLRRSPYWRSGMPVGMNDAWRQFLRAEIAAITER
jgi:hypothetical protein